MAGEIRQPRNVAEVQPLKRTRDDGQRKRPSAKQEEQGRKRKRPDAGGHRVDEYV